jgi:hypothetical protein
MRKARGEFPLPKTVGDADRREEAHGTAAWQGNASRMRAKMATQPNSDKKVDTDVLI